MHRKRPEFTNIVDFHGLLSCSPRMWSFFEVARRVARTDASVLIRGETGTGKELVARALHTLSPRKDAPFRALNCALLQRDLLASELFGHVRGAFTGAVRDREGLFRSAKGGTVFLDEIAEMPLDIQARLLRVAQERQFVPLGATDPIKADVRLLSATHRALRTEVQEGRFRADLMYRIRVVPLFLPRLAERDRDVEMLAWAFIDQFNRHGLRRIDTLADDARDALLSYSWPGNVRELRNVIEYAFAVGEGPTLLVEDLTPELRGEPPAGPPSRPATSRDLERERILDALRKTDGRKEQAATLLGMSRTTLWRKMREQGI